MPEFYEIPLKRGRQSAAVWGNYHALDFKIGQTDLAAFVAALSNVAGTTQSAVKSLTV